MRGPGATWARPHNRLAQARAPPIGQRTWHVSQGHCNSVVAAVVPGLHGTPYSQISHFAHAEDPTVSGTVSSTWRPRVAATPGNVASLLSGETTSCGAWSKKASMQARNSHEWLTCNSATCNRSKAGRHHQSVDGCTPLVRILEGGTHHACNPR